MKVIDAKRWFLLSTLFISSLLIGCKKFVEAEFPIDKQSADHIYTNPNIAYSALIGIYYQFQREDYFGGSNSISMCMGLAPDELTTEDQTNFYYTNDWIDKPDSFWPRSYSFIFSVNLFIEGVEKSQDIQDADKNKLIAHAKFLRAFFYFYLVNLYGDVPLSTTSDYTINSVLRRSPESEVYQQIINDLLAAEVSLGYEYSGSALNTPSMERVIANKGAVCALLARVYLYKKNWSKATEYSTKVIESGKYRLVPLNDVFLKNSEEAILQLDRVEGFNTRDGDYLLPFELGSPSAANSQLAPDLLKLFDAKDLRKVDWVLKNPFIDAVSGDTTAIYNIPYKYKLRAFPSTGQEYAMVLRLAEQYLIRSEAEVMQGNLNNAAKDINEIRKRAGIDELIDVGIGQEALLKAIFEERRKELFSEWGHRWFDLKRTGKLDELMKSITNTKGGNWSAYKMLLPIPIDEFYKNPGLKGHQNPGYSETR